MAKITARHKSMLENPEEVLNLAQIWLEWLKRQWKWLALGLGVVVLVLAAWCINGRMAAGREAQAAAALARLRPQLAAPAAGAEAAKALEQVARDYAGTKAGRDATAAAGQPPVPDEELRRGRQGLCSPPAGRRPGLGRPDQRKPQLLLRRTGRLQEGRRQPSRGWRTGLGSLKGEATQRLALVLEQAGDFKEAAVYWKKLLDEPGNPALPPYLKERLAAAEAKGKK